MGSNSTDSLESRILATARNIARDKWVEFVKKVGEAIFDLVGYERSGAFDSGFRHGDLYSCVRMITENAPLLATAGAFGSTNETREPPQAAVDLEAQRIRDRLMKAAEELESLLASRDGSQS